MTWNGLKRVLKTSLVFNSSGFTLIEAVVGLGLFAILIVINLMMVSSFFTIQNEQVDRREFHSSFAVLQGQLEEAQTCKALFNSLMPLQVSSLVNPRQIDKIQLPNEAQPLIQIDGLALNGKIQIKKISLQLATAPHPPVPNQPHAYVWMTLDYNYIKAHGKVDKVEVPQAKNLLYEIILDATTGKYVTNGCLDYITKRNREMSRLFCLFMNSNPDPATGKCDLFENPDIRATACELTGFQFGGRYCDTSHPI
jgi:type II secretory pathway pseudopilin PulG